MEMSLLSRQVSGLFDSTSQDERAYTDADLSRVFRMIAGSGVAGLDANLRVETAQDGLKTLVHYGAAMCRGYYFELIDDGGDPFTLPHTAVSSMPRVDRVVLRLDLDTQGRAIGLAVIQGTPAQTPAPPLLTRTATVWELSLAQVRISTGLALLRTEDITDERDDDAVCGTIGSAHAEQLIAALDSVYLPRSDGQTMQAQIDAKLPAANVVNNLTTATGGLALDARQGANLAGQIADLGVKAYSFTLTAAGWVGAAAPYAQTVPVSGANTSGYLYQPYPAPASFVNYANAGIVLQNITTNGSVTFHAQKKPAADIAATIARWPLSA